MMKVLLAAGSLALGAPNSTVDLSSSAALQIQSSASAAPVVALSTASLPSVSTASVSSLLEEAQTAYNGRADSAKAQAAISTWEAVLKIDPVNFEALWKLARAHRWLGDHSPEDQKLEIYTKGKDYGERAVKANLNEVQGHYWYAACLGKFAETKGVFKSLMLVKPIRDEMETILNLDPGHAGAHYILGVLYRKAPGRPLSIGNKKKALHHAKKARELDPISLRYAVGLGEAYLALGDKEEAQQTLEDALKMPPNPEYVPESLEDKEAAQKLLADIKN